MRRPKDEIRSPRRLSIEMLDGKKIFVDKKMLNGKKMLVGKKMLIDNKMLVDRNIVDGKNFGDAAMNAEKNALVEFYGRWCGYYKQLELVDRDKFREKYEDCESIVTARIDSTAYEVAKYKGGSSLKTWDPGAPPKTAKEKRMNQGTATKALLKNFSALDAVKAQARDMLHLAFKTLSIEIV